MPDGPQKLEPADLRRYSRQILLGEIGLAGQQLLAAAKVLIVGAGGLGSPAALYLCAAGVGTIGMADLDQVEEHNLQRQLLHTTGRIGQTKVDSALVTLQALNPRVQLIPHSEGITPANAIRIFQAYDIIVDGTDNFAVRYLNNDAAFFARRPLVHGSVYKFEGQVSVFDPAQGGPCYRCLFPDRPAAGSVPGCGDAGVIGALCGIIGSMQAMEVIKLVTGCGSPLRGRLLTYDALTHQIQTLNIPAQRQCPLCGEQPTIKTIDAANYTAKTDAALAAPMNQPEYPPEITVQAARQLLQDATLRALVIDVREPYEVQICQLAGARHIPMRQIPAQLDNLPKDQPLLILCHHGSRSQAVAGYLRTQGFAHVCNIAGGINAWALEIDPTLARY